MLRLAAIVAVLALGACASSGRAKSKDTVAGVGTVDQELAAAQAQIQKTVDALASVVGTPGAGLEKAYEDYVAALDALDAKVQGLRDRSTSMGVRRDAYLKHWIEQTSKIQSVEMRTAAEQRRTQLQIDFMALNSKSSTLKKAYAPLTASLHDCQRFLEADLNPEAAKALAGELEKIRGLQKDVDAAAADCRAQLKIITDKLAIPAPPPPPPAEAPKEPPK